MPEEVRTYKDQLAGRVMLVRKARVVPLEAIVRGYLTGQCLFLNPAGQILIFHTQVLLGRNTRRLVLFMAFPSQQGW